MSAGSSYIYDTRKRCYVRSATSTAAPPPHGSSGLKRARRMLFSFIVLGLLAGAVAWLFPLVSGMMGGAEVGAAIPANTAALKLNP